MNNEEKIKQFMNWFQAVFSEFSREVNCDSALFIVTDDAQYFTSTHCIVCMSDALTNAIEEQGIQHIEPNESETIN